MRVIPPPPNKTQRTDWRRPTADMSESSSGGLTAAAVVLPPPSSPASLSVKTASSHTNSCWYLSGGRRAPSAVSFVSSFVSAGTSAGVVQIADSGVDIGGADPAWFWSPFSLTSPSPPPPLLPRASFSHTTSSSAAAPLNDRRGLLLLLRLALAGRVAPAPWSPSTTSIVMLVAAMPALALAADCSFFLVALSLSLAAGGASLAALWPAVCLAAGVMRALAARRLSCATAPLLGRGRGRDERFQCVVALHHHTQYISHR